MSGVDRWKRHRTSEQGAAAVEFAIISIPLILLVFGIIGFGFAFAQQLALNNGARDAARYAVVADRDCTEIMQRAQDATSTVAMGSDAVAVEVKLGLSEGAASSVCGPGTTPAGAAIPCQGQDEGTRIFVYTRFNGELNIPFGPSESILPLVGKGAFRCEFS